MGMTQKQKIKAAAEEYEDNAVDHSPFLAKAYKAGAEHGISLEKERSKALLEALEKIEKICPPGHKSILPQRALEFAVEFAREAIAQYQAGEK